MEWRKIYKNISTDARFIQLPAFSQLLYLLMIVHADDYGRLPGNILELRYRILPANPEPNEEWEKAIKKIAETELIWWDYKTIQVQNWEKYQNTPHRRKQSMYPEVKQNLAGLKQTELELERTKKNEKETERNEKNLKELKRTEKPPLLSSLLFSYNIYNFNKYYSCIDNKNKIYIGGLAKKILFKWFNKYSRRQFEGVKSDLEMIEGRIKEGYSLRVILLTIKWFCRQVEIEEIPRKYLRPKTLFRRSNFSDYSVSAKEYWFNLLKAKARQREILYGRR